MNPQTPVSLLRDTVMLVGCVWVALMFGETCQATEVEVVLPPIHVPVPWGACRVSTGPHDWVGEFGEVEDSVWLSVVCPRGVQP